MLSSAGLFAFRLSVSPSSDCQSPLTGKGCSKSAVGLMDIRSSLPTSKGSFKVMLVAAPKVARMVRLSVGIDDRVVIKDEPVRYDTLASIALLTSLAV